MLHHTIPVGGSPIGSHELDRFAKVTCPLAFLPDEIPVSTPGSDQRESFSRTSLSLLDRARERDEEAWQRLVALYGPLVGSWCRRSGLSAEDTNDLVQDVFASVAGHLATFRRDGANGTFRGWLRVITRNKIRDHIRRNVDQPDAAGGSTARLQLEQVAQIDDDEEQDRREVASVYARGLDLIRSEFETKTWSAFWQLAVEGQSASDAAESLQMSIGAIRQAKYKVLRRLRMELGDLIDLPS